MAIRSATVDFMAGVGVLLSGIFLASKVAQIFRVTSVLTADGQQRDYLVEG